MSAALADCSSADLYYGIGVPADPVRARQCALLETQRPGGNAGPFTGIGVLMTIYANGRGAARDLDLATSLACRIQGAPAEVDGRVRHLQKLKTDRNDGGDFDYCDDITSGMAAGLCAARDAGIDDMARWDRLDRVTANWSEPERRAFAPLRAAAQAYAEASSENEVDLSGTARAALVIGQEQRLRQGFMDLLDALEGGGLSTESAGTFQAADAELNDIYRQIMAIRTDPDEQGVHGSEDSLPFTTVTRQGIRTAERAWLPYRDAWVAFATVKYPQVSADGLRAVLTRRRIGELEDFLPHGPQ